VPYYKTLYLFVQTLTRFYPTMKKVLLLFLLVFPFVSLNAQTHTFMRRSLPSDAYFTSFYNAVDNSIYVTRMHIGVWPYHDYFDMAKVDTAGNILTNLCFNYDSIFGVTIESILPNQSGFIVGANDQGLGGPDWSAMLASITMNGTVNWAKKYSSSNSVSLVPVMVDASSNSIICIGTLNTSAPDNPVLILRMDMNGNILFIKGFQFNLTSGYGMFHAGLQRKSNGHYLFHVNNRPSAGNGVAPYLLELDSAFNLISAKKFLGIIGTSCSLLLKPDDGFYIIGSYTNIAPYADCFIANFSPAMSVIWAKRTDYTIDSPVDISGVDFNGNGGLVIGGNYYTQDGHSDVMMMELDSLCSVQWNRRIVDAAHNEYLTALIYRPGDGIYATAQRSDTNTANHYGGFYKTDLSGNTVCNATTFSTGFYDFNVVVTNHSVSTTTVSLTSVNEITSPLPGFTMATLCNGFVSVHNEINVPADVIIYPNPVHNTFTISFNGQSAMVQGQLQIFDVMGRAVHGQALTNQSTIIKKQFSPGIYFVKVRDGERVFTKKLVVE
jgi:hypothetical protein